MTFEAWEQVTVGEVARLISRREDVVDEREYRLMGVRWYGNGCRLHTETSGSELKTRALSVVRAGDITYNKMWTSKGAFAVVSEDFDGYHATSEYPTFRPDAKRVDLQFFGHVMRTPQFVSEARSRCRGSTSRARLNPKNFAEIPVLLPPLAEQKKIAEILGSVDEAIQATQAVIDQTRKVKQGLLQQLLTRGIGHTRFKQTEIGEIPESWEVATIKQLVTSTANSLTAGPFGTIFKARDFRDQGVPIVQLRHVAEEGFDWGAKITYMDSAVYRQLHVPYTVRPGDLLITKLGDPPGLACLYPEGEKDGMVTPDVIKASLDSDRMLSHFAVSAYNAPSTKARVGFLTKGGTRPRMTLNEFYALSIPVPPLREQKAIAELIASLDETRRAHREELASLQRSKEGLMSELLSGRVRVQVTP